ncbi:MAG: hypothetical protein ACLU9S_24055 [Oscillospiraceae bacterium]
MTVVTAPGSRSYYLRDGEKGVSRHCPGEAGRRHLLRRQDQHGDPVYLWSCHDTELGTYITDSPVKAVIIYDSEGRKPLSSL